jgi:chemotaxis protein methyltransferase CheR
MVEAATFERVRTLLRAEIGVDLGPDRSYLLEARLGSPTQLAPWGSLEELVAAAERGEHSARTRLVEALVTTETFFFRDSAVFEALRTRILPELFERRAGGEIAVWSAACSSGQEPYSLAMLVRARFPSLARRFRILASDVSEAMVERTREGRYSALEVRRGLDARALAEGFIDAGGAYQVRDDLRRMVEAKVVNLARPLPAIGPFDLVLVRNVLIYVPPAERLAIVARVAERLREGGFLVLGNGESVDREVHGLERVTELRAPIYRRTGTVCVTREDLRNSDLEGARRGAGGGQG